LKVFPIFAVAFATAIARLIDKRRFLNALVLTCWNFATFKLSVKNKAAGTPHAMIIPCLCISFGVGFSALLGSTDRAMRRPQRVERASELAPRLFS